MYFRLNRVAPIAFPRLIIYIYSLSQPAAEPITQNQQKMRKASLVNKLLFATIIGLVASCNSGADKADTKKDSTATSAAPAPVPLQDVMVIMHKVGNFNQWKSGYDSHDTARVASGLHNYVVARGTEDTNMVMIALRMDDVAKAKAFAADPNLKTVMQKAGVTGPADIQYLHVVFSDTSTMAQPDRLMILHKVKDFDAWKKVFDADKPNRVSAGLTDRVVARGIDDTNMASLVFGVGDMAKTKAMIGSKALADKMKEGGVVGAPTVFFYRVVQRY